MSTQTPEAPAYNFEVIERPKVSTGATKGPNPFADVVAQMVKDEASADKAVAIVADMGKSNGSKDRERFENVERIKRQLRDAGAPHEVTVRTAVELNTPKKGQARIAFWPTKKITRKAGDAASAEVPGGATADAAPAE